MNLKTLKSRVITAIEQIREAEAARESVRNISEFVSLAKAEMPVLIETASLDAWENERLRKENLQLTVQVGILTRERDSLRRELSQLNTFGEGIPLDENEIQDVEQITLPNSFLFAVGAD